jgi:NADH dehydrogenase
VQQHVRPGRETEAVWLISPPGDGGRPHVVVVGGGFAGLPAVHGLRRLDGDQVFLPADIVVWASGVRVHDQVARWNVRQGRGGRMITDDHLRVAALNGVFAVGDIAVCRRPVEGNAGGQSGHVVRIPRQGHARDDRKELGGGADQGTAGLTGVLAWVIWIAVHVFSLLGNRNRFATMLDLTARYLFWHRSHNAIVGETPTIFLDQVARRDRVHRHLPDRLAS